MGRGSGMLFFWFLALCPFLLVLGPLALPRRPSAHLGIGIAAVLCKGWGVPHQLSARLNTVPSAHTHASTMQTTGGRATV